MNSFGDDDFFNDENEFPPEEHIPTEEEIEIEKFKRAEEKKKEKERDRIAREILKLSRDNLVVYLRFLDVALSRFQYVRMRKSSVATDGHYLFFNPQYVVDRYKVDKNVTTRDFLHTVLHCVFQHMYGLATMNRPVWDLATDIAVENMITELDIPALKCGRETIQQSDIEEIREHVKYMTADCIYDYLISQNLSEKKIAYMRGSFYADNHEFWYLTMEQIISKFKVLTADTGIRQGTSQDKDKDQKSKEDKNGNGEPDGVNVNLIITNISDGNGGNDFSGRPFGVSEDDAEDWKNISEHIQLDIETFSKRHGNRAGNMVQNLKEVNREKYDYTEFLKQFAVMGEAMKLNDDEFDYIYYTYGMQLYDNVPLIEPLEYKDVKRIKEFVIAIDTSGSTSGDLVQRFLNKTYNILKTEESFFTKFNIHIIQCDADIQEHVKITKQEEFDEYLSKMKIHGMGGTDFRPVFSFVDELIENKEFTNLKGLIYFTDGYGDFPEKMPSYETAFVFVEDGFDIPEVPSWAIKLILRSDEI